MSRRRGISIRAQGAAAQALFDALTKDFRPLAAQSPREALDTTKIEFDLALAALIDKSHAYGAAVRQFFGDSEASLEKRDRLHELMTFLGEQAAL